MFPGENLKRTGDAACAGTRGAAKAVALVFVGFLVGCRPEQKMANQPKYDPLEASTFFSEGMASRPRVAGTIPYQGWKQDAMLYRGMDAGGLTSGFPYPITDQLVDRGEERFNIYCSMCHGRAGYGDGMVVQRGYRKPPSFHSVELRAKRNGHYFDVMTNGFGAMPKYGTMISVEDRWAIVAYVRALQLSQNVTPADLPVAERARITAGEPR